MFKYKTIIVKAIRKYKFYKKRKLCTINRMECDDEISQMETVGLLLKEARKIVPPMRHDLYKGQAGRIGIIGGSLEYTGAPYFAAISALKVGCDLSHVFCSRDAAPVIKSYSPELIVHPILDDKNALELVKPWLPRLHVLVIGPGLGRNPDIQETVARIITLCRNDPLYSKPLIIDADGLFLLTMNPELIKNYSGAILTPNAIEFSRLAESVLGEKWTATPSPDPQHVKALAVALGTNIVILHKGAYDVIASGSEDVPVVKCSVGGSGRRCGGQGDLLSGSLGTFYCWAVLKDKRDSSKNEIPSSVVAAYAGCRLTRDCNQRAVARAGRSTLTTDMIEEIHPAFAALFEG